MIWKLQKKFITITALCLLAVMVVLLVGINAANVAQVNSDSDQLLRMLSDNGGKFPDEKKHKRPFELELTPETQFRTRYFTVRAGANAGADGKPALEVLDSTHIAALTEEEILEYAAAVAVSASVKGTMGNYRYMVTANSDGSRFMVFLDCQESIRSIRNFILLSVVVGLVCMVVVTALVWVFSRRAIKPTIDAVERQKQFITDAGHEIKTPLSIILANTEVLELEQGESQWTSSIRNQVTRLNVLVRNLLELSRLDEVTQEMLEFAEVNVSELLESAVDAFAAPMQTRGLTCLEGIEAGVVIRADQQCLSQLMSILLDNAVKYARDNSQVEVELHTSGKRVELSVYNVCQHVPEDLDRLFERFYRADESRSRKTGGYGIGLSVARGIAQAHKGRIYAEGCREGIRFVVVLPRM
jgi:hypothetical protein